jgi:SAM-dependent methyltransferase
LTAELPFTGERFTPETAGAIWYEHWHRYCAVRELAAGKRVLDCACGEGYGSMLLAGVAASVIGVDIDGPAIRHAAARYGEQANLGFVQGSCTKLPIRSASVDLLVSFETIEHLAEQEMMLAEFARVLGPGGVLVLSSPNKREYGQAHDAVNRFHVRELTREELASRLAEHFPRQAWYGQRVLAHSVLWSEAKREERPWQLMTLADWRLETPDTPAPALYFVVICGGPQASLPRLPALSLFADDSQSLYRDYERSADAQKELYWEMVDARKVAAQRLQEALAVLDQLTNALERERALQAQLAPLDSERLRLVGELDGTVARLRYRESWQGWMRWPLSRLRRLLLPSAARVSE